MRVLLINPPYTRLMGVNEVYMPMGLGYVARYLIENGIHTSIFNADLPVGDVREEITSSYVDMLKLQNRYRQGLLDNDNDVWVQIAEVLEGIRPDVVGITVVSAKLPSARRVAEIAKRVLPECRVVTGGPHATIAPDDLLRIDQVDFVVRGEGEHTTFEVCKAIDEKQSDLRQIAGLSFRDEGEIVHNHPRALESDIDKFRYPTRAEFIGIEGYPKSTISAIITSRGCPFECTFCSAKQIWTRAVRYRNLDDVIEEMMFLKERYSVPSYYFWDDSFTLKRERILELLEKMIKNRIDLPWACTTRAYLLDDELLGRMARAGCFSIEIGLETASERMLRIIKKRVSMETFDRVSSLISRHDIECNVFLMVGFPEETEEDIWATIEYAKRSRATELCLSVFTPYPGCESYESAKEMGMIGDMDWSSYSHQSPENYFCRYVEKERFAELVKHLGEVVDRHNERMSRPSKVLERKIKYYSKNPRLLTGKIRQVWKGSLASRWFGQSTPSQEGFQ